MARTTKIVSFSIPPEVASVFEKMAKSRPHGKSGLFREMVESFRRTQWLDRYHKLQAYGARKAREAGLLTEADIEKLVFRGR